MNPFINPEFFLSICFCLVFGLIVFSPIRRLFKKSFDNMRQKIEIQIKEADEVYKQAFQMHRKVSKDFHTKPQNEMFRKKIYMIKKDFLDKEKNQKEVLLQDFEIRKNLMQQESKNHLRKYLLDDVEKSIKSSHKTTPQEVAHLIQALRENAEVLRLGCK